MKEKIIAIDQGTSSTRAVLYDTKGRLLDAAQEEFNNFSLKRDGLNIIPN